MPNGEEEVPLGADPAATDTAVAAPAPSTTTTAPATQAIDTELAALLPPNVKVTFFCRCEQHGNKSPHPRALGIDPFYIFLAEERKAPKKGKSPAIHRLAFKDRLTFEDLLEVKIVSKGVRRLRSPLKKQEEVTVLIQAKAGKHDLMLTFSGKDGPNKMSATDVVAALRKAITEAHAAKTQETLKITEPEVKNVKNLAATANLKGTTADGDTPESPDNSPPSSPRGAPPGVPQKIWFVSVAKPEYTSVYSYESGALPASVSNQLSPKKAVVAKGITEAQAKRIELQQAVARQNAPRHVWCAADGQVLFLHQSQRWAVSDKKNAESNNVTLLSSHLAEGRLPHEMIHGWCALQGDDWETQPKTQATSDPDLGNALLEQASLTTCYQNCLRVFEYYKANCRPKNEAQKAEVAELDDMIGDLQQSFNEDFQANTELLRPVAAHSPLSEEEVLRVRRLGGKMSELRTTVRDKVRMVETLLGVKTALAETEADAALLNAGKQERYAALSQEASAERPIVRHKDDTLGWGYTLQASQLTQNKDRLLKTTVKADVVTSKLEDLSPSAVAITDTAFYVCQFVDGKVSFVASGENIMKITLYRDWRKVSLLFSNGLIFYLDCGEHEALLVKYLKELNPNIETDSALLEVQVTSPELRKLLTLDSGHVLALQKERDSMRDDRDRWKTTFEEERAKFVVDSTAIRQAGEERVQVLHHSTNLNATCGEEERVRESVVHEEAACFLHILQGLTENLQGESHRWSLFAAKHIKKEKTQLLLASVATVEHSERNELHADEASSRSTLLSAAIHPLAYASLSYMMQGAERVERYTLIDAYANDMLFYTRQHLKGLIEVSSRSYEASKRMNNEKIALENDLNSFKEKHEALEQRFVDEVNTSGALMRSNKVLTSSLGACKYVDILRVKADGLHLMEEIGRSKIEMDSMQQRQLTALNFSERFLGMSDTTNENILTALQSHIKAAGLEAQCLVGGPAKYDDKSVAALNSACIRLRSGFERLRETTKQKTHLTHQILGAVTRGFATASRGDFLWNDEQQYTDILQPAVYPTQEGWLQYNANPIIAPHNWKKRYFVFANGLLQYKHPNSSRFVKLFSVVGIVAVTPVEVPTDGPNSHSSPRKSGADGNFFIVETISGDTMLKFSSKSADERHQWVSCLKKAISVHGTQIGRSKPPTAMTKEAKRTLKLSKQSEARAQQKERAAILSEMSAEKERDTPDGGASPSNTTDTFEPVPFPPTAPYQGYIPPAPAPSHIPFDASEPLPYQGRVAEYGGKEEEEEGEEIEEEEEEEEEEWHESQSGYGGGAEIDTSMI